MARGTPTCARDLMSSDITFLKDEQTAMDAAHRLAESGVGAMPVCDASGHLRGMVTDRDLVVSVLAKDKDPASVRLSELVQGEAVTIGADDDIDETLRTMTAHKVRRLPVIDGTKLVGIVTQADVARALPPDKTGQLVAAISS